MMVFNEINNIFSCYFNLLCLRLVYGGKTMNVHLKISEADNYRLKMILDGQAQGEVVFNSYDTLVEFTRNCIEYVINLKPVFKPSVAA
jgi:hypothetical protein